MGNEALIRALLMDAIANDYEDFNMIVDEVTGWAKERGVLVAPSQISENLRNLIDLGLAKAYRLSPTSSPEEIRPETLREISVDQGKRSIKGY
jgi:hypothetical protein